MKLSPSQIVSEYGQVIFPSVAAVIGLAALMSQWVDNHRLRGEVERLNAERTASVKATQIGLQKELDKNKTYIKDLNKWIDGMNGYFASIRKSTQEAEKATQIAQSQKSAISIVAMFKSGATAGVEWKGKTKEALVEEVMVGAAPPSGAFAHMTFKMPRCSEADLGTIYRFITYSPSEGLEYDKEGNQPGGRESQGTPRALAADGLLMPKLPEP